MGWRSRWRIQQWPSSGDQCICIQFLVLGSAWYVCNLRHQDVLQTELDRWELWHTQHYNLQTKSRLLQVINLCSCRLVATQRRMIALHFNGQSLIHSILVLNLGCSALLWHRLMGTRVLLATFNGTDKIRVYAHCSKQSVSLQ